jgi:hypothetical protein
VETKELVGLKLIEREQDYMGKEKEGSILLTRTRGSGMSSALEARFAMFVSHGRLSRCWASTSDTSHDNPCIRNPFSAAKK